MDRKTRDKFVIPTNEDLTSGNSCLETPPAVFAELNEKFGPFELDLTADAVRHLLPRWFGPDSNCLLSMETGQFCTDALVTPWHQYGKNGYSNPPYGRFVPRILRKAKEEAKLGFSSTLLLPVRMTKAFHQHVLQGAAELHFCDKRLVFYENGFPKLTLMEDGTRQATTALFDSMIVRYMPGIRFSPPRVYSWKVPPHCPSKKEIELLLSQKEG